MERRMRRRIAGVLLLALLAGGASGESRAASGEPPAGAADRDLADLADWMSGSFSSAAQAAADSNYLDIRLQMVPIWRERADGPWLYVEQAVAGREAHPYRQRIYHLSRVSGREIESAVFLLPAAERFAGAWRTPERFAVLTPDSLSRREGCAIRLERRSAEEYVGSTRGHDCASSLRGAAYATAEVTIRPDLMISWDRGFDADGFQVWGAVDGGYRFRKLAVGER
jgi:hypothetical protein